MTKRLQIAVVTLAVLFHACSDKAPVNISDSRTHSTPPETLQSEHDPQLVGGTPTGTQITLGKAIDPDNTIVSPTEAFEKTDTIYVSVNTGSSTGTPNAGTLTAKWSYRTGEAITPLYEESRKLTATGPTISEFHLKNPQGLAAGGYQVELLLDDRPVGVRTFTVQ